MAEEARSLARMPAWAKVFLVLFVLIMIPGTAAGWAFVGMLFGLVLHAVTRQDQLCPVLFAATTGTAVGLVAWPLAAGSGLRGTRLLRLVLGLLALGCAIPLRLRLDPRPMNLVGGSMLVFAATGALGFLLYAAFTVYTKLKERRR